MINKKENTFDIKIIIFVLVAIIFAIDVISWIGIRMTIYDDVHIAHAYASGNIWSAAISFAQEQGRIQGIFFILIWGFILNFENSLIYDALHFGTYYITIIFVAFYLKKIFSYSFAILFLLVYISTTNLMWDHNLLVAVPFYHFFLISCGFGSLLIARQINNSLSTNYLFTKKYLMTFLFFLSCLGHEYMPVLFLLLHYSTTGRKYDLKNKFNEIRKLFYDPITIVFSLYIIAYMVFRYLNPSDYTGNVVGISLSQLPIIISTLINFAISGNQFYWFLMWAIEPYLPYLGHHFSIVYFSPDYDFIEKLFVNPLILNLDYKYQLIAFIQSTLLLFSGILIVKYNNFSLNKRSSLITIIVFLILIFFPSFLLSLSAKYREWHTVGVLHYSYTTISQVAFSAFIVYFILKCLSYLKNLRNLFLYLFILILFVTNFFTNQRNYIISESMRDNSIKWELLEDISFMDAHLVESKNIYSPFLTSYVWSVPTDKKYWQDYLFAKYNTVLNFIEFPDKKKNFYNVYNIRANTCKLNISVFEFHNDELDSKETYLFTRNISYDLFLINTRNDTNYNQKVSKKSWKKIDGGYLYLIEGRSFTQVDCFPIMSYPKQNTIPLNKVVSINDPVLVLLDGWHAPESFGRWTSSNESHLRISAFSDNINKFKITLFDLKQFQYQGGDNLLQIASSDSIITFKNVSEDTYEACINFNEENEIYKIIYLGKLYSPIELDLSEDPRKLGLSFSKIQFSECK